MITAVKGHIRYFACIVGLATLVVACGGGSDADQIGGIYPSFLSAMRQGNWSEACSDISYESRSQFVAQAQSSGIDATSCPQALTKVTAEIPGFVHNFAVATNGVSLDVRSVAVRGSHATARVEAKANGRTVAKTAAFVRERGRWRLSLDTSGGGLAGLLDAFNSNGSGTNQGQGISQQEQSALDAVNATPNSAAAWSHLVQARWTTAGAGKNFDSATSTFTTSGKRKLAVLTQDWERYLQLTKSPDPNLAVIAARSYTALGNYAGAAGAWEVETLASPSRLGYECMAASAYAAGQTDKATLALNKALTYVPQAQQAVIKTEVTAAKTQPTIVQRAC